MKYILKTDQSLLNCSNEGKSPFDKDWNKNEVLELKVGDEVILQKEVYTSVTLYRISKRVEGVKFYKIIKEER